VVDPTNLGAGRLVGLRPRDPEAVGRRPRRGRRLEPADGRVLAATAGPRASVLGAIRPARARSRRGPGLLVRAPAQLGLGGGIAAAVARARPDRVLRGG